IRGTVGAFNKRKPFKNINQFAVACIAWYFVGKVPHQVMYVTLLNDLRPVKNQPEAHLPEAALCNEAAPNISHAEAAKAGQVHERISRRKPPSALAIERAPRSTRQMHAWPRLKIEGLI